MPVNLMTVIPQPESTLQDKNLVTQTMSILKERDLKYISFYLILQMSGKREFVGSFIPVAFK